MIHMGILKWFRNVLHPGDLSLLEYLFQFWHCTILSRMQISFSHSYWLWYSYWPAVASCGQIQLLASRKLFTAHIKWICKILTLYMGNPVKVKVTQWVSDSFWPLALYTPWNSPGQEWVAISFSRGSSQARDRIQVSRIAGWWFTS